MILQNILWPQAEFCSEKEMYYRGSNHVHDTGSMLVFDQYSIATFDTYFNSLTINKWKKYTIAQHFFLELKVIGKFRITLLQKEKINHDVLETTLEEQIISALDLESVRIPISLHSKGMIYFRLESLDEKAKFYGGYYGCDIEENECHKVKIAIDICTFRREDFIKRNIDILNQFVMENQESPLYEKLEVFISDNGNTLDINALESSNIHIVKNKNVGGAGGFTRGLIEIMESNTHGNGITHVLLMDDDILINPEALERTYRILSLLKEEYIDAFIGGAMLRNDRRNIQVESGAVWNAGRLVSLKAGLDLSNCEACLYNEIEEYCEYNAWWYCCFPITIVRPDNLPIPIFIRGDDLEYGLRNMKTLILLNGICVWHEPFENKYSSSLFYYILRNQAIDNVLHCPSYTKKDFKRDITSRVARELMLYRYKNVYLLLRGVNDFLKGVDWLAKTDGEQLHQEIMKLGYRAEPIEKLDIPFLYSIYDKSLIENDHGFKRFSRLATLNGYLLPTKRNNIVSMAAMRPYNAYRSKRILNYDMGTGKGFISEKSIREMVDCLKRYCSTIRRVNRHFDEVAYDYRKNSHKVQTVSFWKSYLNTCTNE